MVKLIVQLYKLTVVNLADYIFNSHAFKYADIVMTFY